MKSIVQYAEAIKGNIVYNKITYTIVLALIFLMAGCSVRRFPVVRPVVEQSRSVYARAKAQEHFIRARDYERRGLGKMAEREYEKALQLDPNSGLLKQQVVRNYIESGKFTQALLLIKEGRKNEELNRDEKRIVSTIYLKMGEIAQAAWVLETIKDKSEEELYSLGLIYESLGNVEKALLAYQRCFQQHPDAIEVGFKIGRMLFREKKFDAAESLLVEMQLRDGLQADIYSLRAAVAVGKGDTAAGLAFFDSALTVDSLHEETLRNKAQLYIGRSDFPAAIACYKKLAGLDATGVMYGQTLAMLYYYNRQFAESETLLQQLLASSMGDYELHYLLGLVFAAVDKSDLARIEFEKALTLQPGYKDAWYEFCSMLIRKKTYEEAYEVADRFAGSMPKEALSWRMKGHIASLMKNYSGAITSYRKAIALDSADIFAWFELGSALERNREIDRATKAFKKVLQLRPGDPATLNYLGYMWAEQGKNLDTAKVFLEQALQKEPQNGAFLDSYAWIFYQMGDYDSAFVYLQKATERIFDDPELFHHMGDVMVKRNDLDGAIASYSKSLELNADDGAVIRKKIVDCEIIRQRERQVPR